MLEQDEDSGKGGTFDATATTGRLGDDAADRQYRSILHFDTATLPDDAVITGVTLRIKRRSITGTNPFTTHGLLTVDAKTGAFHDNPVLERSTSRPSAAGAMWAGSSRPRRGLVPGAAAGRSYPLINLTGTTQFRLRFATDDNDDQGADYLSFYTGNASPWPTGRELIVTYYLP